MQAEKLRSINFQTSVKSGKCWYSENDAVDLSFAEMELITDLDLR